MQAENEEISYKLDKAIHSQSEGGLQNVIKYFDFFLKIATLLALASVAFLGTKFVTHDEFKKASELLDSRVSKIEEVLIRMEANYEVDKRHYYILSDHETRIRLLEKTSNAR